MLARLCRAGAARAMPGSWGLAAIGKKSCRSSPTGGLDFMFSWYAGQAMPGRFAETVGLDDSFEIFFLGRIHPGAGSAGLLCRAGAAGLCRAAGASQPFAKNAAGPPPQEDWNFCDIGATNVKETRLGEPVLGEPSNEVGASHQTRLGEPVLSWASQY